MLGTAIPGSCGSSTRCAGRLLHRQSPIRRTSPLPSSNRSCRGICSCALRMLTIFTSKQDRGTSSTCTANYSRAVAIRAAVHHFTTRAPMIRKPSFHDANAAAKSDLIFAGSAKCRSNWTGFSAHSTNARFSWRLEPLGGRARSQFRRPCPWPGADHLCRAGRARECLRVYGMSFGQSGRGAA